MYLLVRSLCKISKRSLEWIQSYEDASLAHPKWPICPKWDFFSQKLLIQIPRTCWPLSLSKISKKSLEQIQSYEQAPFLGLKWPICLKWEKNYYIFHVPLGPFHWAKFQKNPQSGSTVWCTIFRQKIAHLPQRYFFSKNLLINLVHSCISKSKKLESDVNPLPRYWRLKNTEI